MLLHLLGFGELFLPFYHKTHFSPHSTQSRTFLPQCPQPHSLCPAPLTDTDARRFSVLGRDRACPPAQDSFSPLQVIIVLFSSPREQQHLHCMGRDSEHSYSSESHSLQGSWRGSVFGLPSSLLDEFCAKLGLGVLSLPEPSN